MSTNEIVTLFTEASDACPAICSQPTDEDMFALQEYLYPLLLDIPYDRLNGTTILVGIIDDVTDNSLYHGKLFPVPMRVGVYNNTITKDDTTEK